MVKNSVYAFLHSMIWMVFRTIYEELYEFLVTINNILECNGINSLCTSQWVFSASNVLINWWSVWVNRNIIWFMIKIKLFNDRQVTVMSLTISLSTCSASQRQLTKTYWSCCLVKFSFHRFTFLVIIDIEILIQFGEKIIQFCVFVLFQKFEIDQDENIRKFQGFYLQVHLWG